MNRFILGLVIGLMLSAGFSKADVPCDPVPDPTESALLNDLL